MGSNAVGSSATTASILVWARLAADTGARMQQAFGELRLAHLALDALALALTTHDHEWTAAERTAYEAATRWCWLVEGRLVVRSDGTGLSG